MKNKIIHAKGIFSDYTLCGIGSEEFNEDDDIGANLMINREEFYSENYAKKKYGTNCKKCQELISYIKKNF